MPPPDSPNVASSPPHASSEIPPEIRIQNVGRVLSAAVRAVADAIPGTPQGPVEVARRLGIDKVLASRVLKATRQRDPVAALHDAPGPETLRRFIRAAKKRGVPDGLVKDANDAVRSFEQMIRQEAGDRSALDVILSAWLPESRATFELRRKQMAFRAMGQLKGVAGNVMCSTAILHPSDDGEHLDVVWLFGLVGLKRLRPGSPVKFISRRVVGGEGARLPRTLTGQTVSGLEGLRLDQFCSTPPPALEVHHVGEIVHYMLAGAGFGLRSACDLVFAEVNFKELPRYSEPDQPRKRYIFEDVTLPVKLLIVDALVHRDVFSGNDPRLVIYDTACEGFADPNDPARYIDRLDTSESIQHLGWGVEKFRSADEPRYAEMLQHVWDSLGWSTDEFRGYRCRIDYPIYGSQVVMLWPPDYPPNGDTSNRPP